MQSTAPAQTFARRPLRALLRTCGLILQLIAGLWAGLPAQDAAADDTGRSYADARRRADLEHSEAQRECARMGSELRTDCLARGRATHEIRMSAARERFPDVAAPPLDPETSARFERDLVDCDRLPGVERPGCRLDVKRRYRH